MAAPVVNDKGTRIEVTFTKASDGSVLDISSATGREMRFRKPSEATVTVNQASTPNSVDFVTDGTDGKIEYVVPDTSFWDQDGYWRIQGRVVMPNDEYGSEPKIFEVIRRIPA